MQAENSSRNVLSVLERDILRNLRLLDLSVIGARDALGIDDISQASSKLRKTALFDRSASAEDLGSIAIFDQEGNIVETSQNESRPFNLRDREYFRVHENDPNRGLFISRAFQSRLRDGDWRIALSRRIDDKNGRFSGIVAGSIRLSYFERLFGNLDLGRDGAIVLYHDNGRVVLRSPFNDRDVDRDFSQSDTFRLIESHMNGSVVARAQVDGIQRLYTAHRIGDTSLVLSVNRSVEDIFAEWRRRAALQGLVLVGLCVIIFACCWKLVQEVKRREALEAQLRSSAQELELLASTDSLTGVATKRILNDGLYREWRRSKRSQAPLSILMVDIDHFKAFNDIYGHVAGDDALIRVAQAICSVVRRPSDIVGRFGGEEFQVIIPDTTVEQAAHVAANIKAAVLVAQIEHNGSEFQRISVSVGVATLDHSLDTPESLVIRADQALYAAKAAGRNTVFVSGEACLEDLA